MGKLPEQWLQKLKKLKYPLLVLLVGVFLLLLPSGKRSESKTGAATQTTEAVQASEEDYCRQEERRLAEILSKVSGAGKVEVMLTLRSGAQTVYQADQEIVSEREGDGVRSETTEKTVVLSRGSGYEEPAVVKTVYPVYLGALIVAEGADNAAVKLDLVNAVAGLTGLGADKITVVKMK